MTTADSTSGEPSPSVAPGARPSDQDRLATLFALSREVTGVLDLDELLTRIPRLIARLTPFGVFSVYLLDEAGETLRIAYAEGYPEAAARQVRLALGQGTVGTAVKEQRSILLNDVASDPRYISVVPGVQSTLVVPLRNKGAVIGALNLLSSDRDAFDDTDEAMLRAFAAPIAQAIVNARLFESEREYSETMATLAEVGREMSGILDLDELLTRVAHLVKRVIAYRTFGIALLNDDSGMIEFKVAISYGEASASASMKIGEGLLGYAVQHKEVVLAPDVAKDPRYINAVPDAKSELVVPLLVKDRCIGAFDLESPELNAFSKRHVELLTLLASEAAVAIENARLWEALRANELRIEKELRFAQRVQMALLPRELPKRIRAVDVSWRFEPARELGGDLYEFLAPEPNQLIVAVGDVSGKGVPAALYSVFASEVVRSRTFRRRASHDPAGPGPTLTSINRILHERELEEYYCTLCYAIFDLRRHTVTMANSGLPYPIRCTADGATSAQIELPGVPLGSFGTTTYDEIVVPANIGDVFVFCSDGISETFSESGAEFGSARIAEVVRAHRDKPAAEIVERIFATMSAFRGNAEQTDDQTAVVVRIVG
jgi:sigma-B regulation protein RsbU (phosphoserine phosphatase)